MSSSEFTQSPYWAGRPVAYKIADAQPRGRVVVTGTIIDIATLEIEGVTSSRYVLDDATDQLDLLFLGRPRVAGLSIGTSCTAEGTARLDGDRLVVWNPLYCVEPSESTCRNCENGQRERNGIRKPLASHE
jgi:hypothetical protein